MYNNITLTGAILLHNEHFHQLNALNMKEMFGLH